MVSLALTAVKFFKTASRARGQDRSCILDSLRPCNTSLQANLRVATYDESFRLVTCSKDPIGFTGSKWNLFEYVDGRPVDHLDPTGKWGCPSKPPGLPSGAPNDPIDGPPTQQNCDWLNCVLDRWAVGLNQTLLDHWRGGSGSHMNLSMGAFDPTGAVRAGFVQTAIGQAATAVAGKKCGSTASAVHTGTSAERTLLTPMILNYTMRYDCRFQAKKHCVCKDCHKITVIGSCFFKADDRTDFNPGDQFGLPGIGAVADNFVNKCNPGHKDFNISAISTQHFSERRACDGSPHDPGDGVIGF